MIVLIGVFAIVILIYVSCNGTELTREEQKKVDDYNNAILKRDGYGGCSPYKYVNGKAQFINRIH